MKIINLRNYYPNYAEDCFVEVPEEVALIFREFELREEAYRIRTYRYKARYSLETDEEIARTAKVDQLPLDELLYQKQVNHLLYSGISTLSEKQQRRIYAHYFLRMGIREIAESEKCSYQSVRDSIERGCIALGKYFANHNEF